jgi:hypothetical protein
MAHHVQVRVVNRRGTPLGNERVSIFATSVTASSSIPDQRTDNNGLAEFDLDVPDPSEVVVYVRGRERCERAPLRDRYDISI